MSKGNTIGYAVKILIGKLLVWAALELQGQ
jgi:hypothetical protein